MLKGSEVEFKAAADWYAELAQKQGWWDHCRYAVQQLESDDSGLYKGLRLAVRERIEAAKAKKMQMLQKSVSTE